MKKSLFVSVAVLIILSPFAALAQEAEEPAVVEETAAVEEERAPGDAPPPVEITMIDLPGGSVEFMGHVNVSVDGFQLSAYEFTNRQAADLLNWAMLEGHLDPQLSNKSYLSYNGREFIKINTPKTALIIPNTALLEVRWLEDNQPLPYITPFGAMVLCNLLSIKEGLTPCYDLDELTWDRSADGYRLPTSAEFEWALRYTDNGMIPANRAPGIRNYDEHCWHLGNRFTAGKSILGDMGSHLVGTRKVSDLGLYDMAGNMSEICWDRYQYAWYPEEGQQNPDGPEPAEDEKEKRYKLWMVTRGGSWNLPAGRLKTGSGGYILFDKYNEGVGFRLAKGTR